MPNHPGNINILLAEDDRTMRRIEIRTLNKLGFTRIIEAVNGEDAIRKLQQNPDIQLIISDWNMPEITGFELLVWVRDHLEYKEIPFIMATGQADKTHAQRALDKGVNAVLVKPFADEELQQAMDQALFGPESRETQTPKQAPRTNDSGKIILRMSHIQITDHLVLGVLQHLIETRQLLPQHFELELHCKSGWNPVAASLEKQEVDAACILAPLAMDLYNFGTPLKMVLLSHKNGSAFVRTTHKIFQAPYPDFYRNSSFLIPHKMSVHHMLSHLFLGGIGLSPSMDKGKEFNIEFEVVPPVSMSDFLEANPDNSGFMVAEPMASQAIASGVAKLQFLSSELWENHPCCLVTFQEAFIDQYPEVVYEFTRLLVQAGEYITQHPGSAASIALTFLDPDRELNLTAETLEKVLTEPGAITTDDLYPVVEDLEAMQNYMVHEMGIGSRIDLDRFVDLRFADKACNRSSAGRKKSLLHDSGEKAMAILYRGIPDHKQDKTMSRDQNREQGTGNAANKLNADTDAPLQNNPTAPPPSSQPESSLEGKYLTFLLNDEEYGISIMNIKEIIGMIPITHVPRTPPYIKGVINLRGKVIPVMDLRLKFEMPAMEYTERTCILIVEVPGRTPGTVVQMGIVVDTVSEVVNIRAEEIEQNSLYQSNLNTNAIIGMAKTGEGIKILLNIANVVSMEG